jgi:hypothetical protein
MKKKNPKAKTPINPDTHMKRKATNAPFKPNLIFKKIKKKKNYSNRSKPDAIALNTNKHANHGTKEMRRDEELVTLVSIHQW